MITDKELGLKVAEDANEAFLEDLIRTIKLQVDNLKTDLKFNTEFLEFDLKQKQERLKFLEDLKGGLKKNGNSRKNRKEN